MDDEEQGQKLNNEIGDLIDGCSIADQIGVSDKLVQEVSAKLTLLSEMASIVVVAKEQGLLSVAKAAVWVSAMTRYNFSRPAVASAQRMVQASGGSWN